MGGLHVCAAHSGRPAYWVCEACDELACEQCVFADQSLHVQLVGCAKCGHNAVELKMHREEQRSFRERVGEAFVYPLSKDGLIAMVLLSALTGFFQLAFEFAFFPLKPLMFAFWMGTFFSFIFHLVRQTSRGNLDFTPPDYRDLWADHVLPTIRGTVPLLVLWAPAAIYLQFYRSAESPLWSDPWLWVITLLSIIYAPMAFLIAAVGGSLWRMLNPAAVYANVVRLRGAYGLAMAMLAVLAAIHVVLHFIGSTINTKLHYPMVTAWFAEVLSTYAPFAGAYVLGTLLYVHGDRLGYGLDRDYFVSRKPDQVRPTGAKADAARRTFVRATSVEL